MVNKVGLAFGVLLTVACQAPAKDTSGVKTPWNIGNRPAPQDTCGAAGFEKLIGRDQAALATMTLPERTRIIAPGMAVTMDHLPDRLNIYLDDKGQIIRVGCG